MKFTITIHLFTNLRKRYVFDKTNALNHTTCSEIRFLLTPYRRTREEREDVP